MSRQHRTALVFSVALGSFVAFGLVAAGPSARADETYLISGEIWDYYQGYLDKIGHGRRPGAFAITTDGLGASYSWCDQQRCRTNMNLSTEVRQDCEKAYETDCVIFAIRDEIRVQYEIRK